MIKFFFFLFILDVTSCFEVNRLQQGDVISGQQIDAFCGVENTCACSDGQTFYAENEVCVSDVQECSLVTKDASNQLHKILTVKNTLSDSYAVDILTNSSSPVCSSGEAPSAGPIFVYDYANNMKWNANWAAKLQRKVTFGTTDLEKVKVTFTKHWSGLFVKLYLKCGSNFPDNWCITVKFEGLRSYPLSDDAITEIFPDLFITPSSKTEIKTSFITPVISSATNTETILLSEDVNSSPQVKPTLLASPSMTVSPSLTVSPSMKASPSMTVSPSMSVSPSVTASQSTGASPSLAASPTVSTQPVIKTNTTQTTVQRSQSIILQNTSTVTITPPNQTAAPILGTDDGDVTAMYVGISVAVFLFVFIVFLIWFCRRRRKKIKMETNKRVERYPHASIRSLHSNSSSSSLTSPPAVLNKSSLGAIPEKVENPLYKDDDHDGDIEENRPSSHVTVEKIRRGSNSSNSAYDNPGYSRNDYFGDDEFPEFSNSGKDLPKFFYEAESDDLNIHYADIQKVRRHDLEPIVESPRSTNEDEDEESQ